jgi:hypothetical protein
VVQIVKDRRYFQKPSKIKSIKTAEHSRLQKRAHSLKKLKIFRQLLLRKLEPDLVHSFQD